MSFNNSKVKLGVVTIAGTIGTGVALSSSSSFTSSEIANTDNQPVQTPTPTKPIQKEIKNNKPRKLQKKQEENFNSNQLN